MNTRPLPINYVEIDRERKSLQKGREFLDNQQLRQELVVDDVHQFLTRELPARETMLSPWLLNQGLAMIHSWRGTGKTHVALGVAYAVAAGGQFLGWNAPQPRKVLFIDGEMPGAALQERLAAIIKGSDKEPVPGMLRLVTPDIQPAPMPDLATDEGQQALDEVIESDTALVILDNLSALCRTGKENESESWLSVATWALRQRAAGRSVLFIHHSGKDLKQRGTSRREDLLDTVICLRRPSDYQATDGARFEVHFEKARHMYGDAVLPIDVRLVTDNAGRQTWGMRPVEESTFDRVVSLAKDGLTQREIATELDVNKSNVCRAWKKAESLGLITNATR